MENNINENEFVPVSEIAEVPTEEKVEFAGVENSGTNKPKKSRAKLWILLSVCAAVLVAAVVTLLLLSNTYRTPVKALEKLLNSDSADQYMDRLPALLNGFAESDVEKLMEIYKETDKYENQRENRGGFANNLEARIDKYGADFKIKVKVVEKIELEKEEISAFRDELRKVAQSYKDEYDNMDSDDYKRIANSLGLKKSEVKEMVKLVESFSDDFRSAKVSEGYKLTLKLIRTDCETGATEEWDRELTVSVFRVNGRWLIDVFQLYSQICFTKMGSLLYFMFGGL